MNSLSSSSYLFNNMGRIGSDVIDQTQRNLHNTRFANYMLSDYFSDKTSTSQVNFAVQQPTMMVSSRGVASDVIDVESILTLKAEQNIPLEKLQLFPRPFITVPYLGKGHGDPVLESQLMQGELVSDKKSVSTIMDKSFSQYSQYPLDNDMQQRITDGANIQEIVLDGWTRGGTNTRNIDVYKKK